MSIIGHLTDEEWARLRAPEEWAGKTPVEGPHFTVVGAPESVATWPELALPWRISADSTRVHWLHGEWTCVPEVAAQRWARVRWMEKYDGEGCPRPMWAIVTHADGRQWRVQVQATWVIEFNGYARQIDADSGEAKANGGEG